MSRKILGIDIGTTSIGWAFITEAENDKEKSTIERIGVRVNPLTTDEQTNFEKGKPVSVNADRTLKRSARRNLQRYKQRRKNLINVLIKNNIINAENILAENDKYSTHRTYILRNNAANKEISKEDFARVLLMINKKRGYKSSRKAKNEEEGLAIDGMAVAKRLYEENLTPGQLCYRLLKDGKKSLPDFYRSDLNAELDKVWHFQKKFYPEILNDEFRKTIEGKGQRATAASFWGEYGLNTAEIKGTRDEKKLKAYEWRSKATHMQLSKEETAYVITEINSNINNSSGYLGAISDRSKELYFNKETIGQYLHKQLQANPHTLLKNQVFYRQDYLDEFETIWEIQTKFHKELTSTLKEEIRDIIIFYQRKLKSQKNLVSFCEFESKKNEVIINGKITTKTIGYKVTPKSSPLFQEFKIWQNLNSLLIQNKETKAVASFDMEAKQLLYDELNLKGNLSKETVLTILGYKPKDWELNFSTIEGNRTSRALYEAYLKILETEGYDIKELLQVKTDKDETKLQELVVPAFAIKKMVRSIFDILNINTAILDFNAELDGKDFEQQSSYQLWHLLYSYEGDNSTSGNEKLHGLLQTKFGFKLSHAKILANISLSDDYGSLSAKAIRKIFPFIRENKYSEACKLAGYNHSSSLTKEENENRPLRDKLELLPKNSLRNPVVEKILNQMINVINAIIADPSLGKPDEIRIELARELKNSAEERAEMSSAINKATEEHERIKQVLTKEDGIANPTRNDIIRYKLYQELKNNGYKTLYSNTYIPREKLFSKEFDIEHIIPQALLFDDSFSNKTLCVRQENLAKGNKCAREFIGPYFGEDKVVDYLERVEMLYQINSKSTGDGIGKAKYKKLMMKAEEIGQGFIERDLRDTQYIAKRARRILEEICRTVVPTTGSVTNRLREDWDLVNIMQELNMDKYRKLGLTEMIEKKNGGTKERILDWTKRNDHRHHAMDALTIAFTKRAHIQYLNNLNARKQEDKKGAEIRGIEQKETYIIIDDTGNKKRRFKLPLTDFRAEAKKHLESVLVSYKAKNKVVTKNKNKFKTKIGEKTKIELTPRGQLHKETVYGRLKQYAIKEEKIGVKFDEQMIQKVASEKYRNILLQRLRENDNDPKKAFTGKNSFDKNPIYLDEAKTQSIPDKIKLVWLEDDYTIRKEVTPDNFKDIKNLEKIIDVGTRNILKKRLEENSGNAKDAFSNLDKNPIWLNKEKGIAIKRVTISGAKTAEALHVKKDHHGKLILDENGNKIPADFVSTGNNHHVAIYRDAEGNLQDNVISFYETVEKVNQGLPVVDKFFNQHLGWQFLFTMKQNEYFVFPSENFDPSEVDLMNSANYKLISPNLFRVQKFSKIIYGNSAVRDYVFRHNYETIVEEKKELKDIAYKQIKSLAYFEKIVKVRINHIGQIIKIGEY
jgi:CRISPR-associated endonuclease Csn1